MEEVYVSFECTAKLYFRGPQRPVEHRCRVTLGANKHQKSGSNSCVLLTVEGKACQRRTFRVIKENVTKVAARLGDGAMTVVFRNSCCDSLVVKEVTNRSALTLCHKIISGIWMGIGDTLSEGSARQKFNSSPGGPMASSTGPSLSKSSSGKKKLQLNLGKRFGETRGAKMLEASQSKPAAASSFYKTDSQVVSLSDSFIPQTPPTSSPYFQRPARRNLNLDLSNEKGSPRDREGGKISTPQNQGTREHMGPRKAAIIARKRLPLGDIHEQTRSSTTLRDYLTFDEPSNREGFANLGNTCYMNAVLQVLLGLEPFAEDLLNHQLIKRVNPHSLCRMMYLLLKSKRTKDSYDSQKILLKKIKSVIESSRPKFSGCRQQDAHELLTQCLDQLKDDSKHIKISTTEEGNQSEFSVCPVVRNFECEVCRSITCKSCSKVTEVSEVIYDFALQLPKSVLLRPNEQANLQDLVDAFFVSEEVEYKCPMCSSNAATMSCRLSRLPRVMILFLKRYGYNPNLSRNSKRIDFIRIPRFISVGHLCSETTKPPFEYQGPWPSESPATDKENLPSIDRPNALISRGLPESIVNGDSGILGKRRSSEKVDNDVPEINSDVVKRQKVDHISNLNSVSSHLTATANGDLVTCKDQATNVSQNSVGRDIAAEFDSLFSPEVILEFFNESSPDNALPVTATSGNATSAELTITTTSSVLTTTHTVMSAGTVACSGSTGCAAVQTEHPLPHNSSPADNKERLMLGLFGGVDYNHSNPTTPAAPRTPTTGVGRIPTAGEGRTPTAGVGRTPTAGVGRTPTAGVGRTPTAGVGRTPTAGVGRTPTAGVGRTPTAGVGRTPTAGVEGTPTAGVEGTPTTNRALQGEQEQHIDSELGEEDEEGLKRAMEESMKEQSGDVLLLQQLGLSEEEQLKLALELSVQEQCPVEESSMVSSARVETPTPDSHQPQAYKLMGIINHIGRASSGGHYISDVCSAREGVWRSYNDCHVYEAREEDIRQKRQGTSYIFFYMHKSILGNIGISDKRTT